MECTKVYQLAIYLKEIMHLLNNYISFKQNKYGVMNIYKRVSVENMSFIV